PYSFLNILEPLNSSSDYWAGKIKPKLKQDLEFNVIIGADGEGCILANIIDIKRKEFKAGLALAITTNFVNENKVEELNLREFGLSFQYHRKWFGDLKKIYNCSLGNITFNNRKCNLL